MGTLISIIVILYDLNGFKSIKMVGFNGGLKVNYFIVLVIFVLVICCREDQPLGSNAGKA